MAPSWTLPFVLSNTLWRHSQDSAPCPCPHTDTRSHPDTQNILCLPSTAPQTEERPSKARGVGLTSTYLASSLLSGPQIPPWNLAYRHIFSERIDLSSGFLVSHKAMCATMLFFMQQCHHQFMQQYLRANPRVVTTQEWVDSGFFPLSLHSL